MEVTPQETENKIEFDQAKKQSRMANGSPRAKWLNKRLLSVPVTLEITATTVPESSSVSEQAEKSGKEADKQGQPGTTAPDSKEQGFQPGGGQAPGTPSEQETKSKSASMSKEKSAEEPTGQPSGVEWQNATQKARAAKGAKAAMAGGKAGGTAEMAGLAEKAAVANPVMRVVLLIFIGNKKLFLHEPMTPVEKYGTILLDLLIIFTLLIIVMLLIIIFVGPCLKMAGVSDIIGMDNLSRLIVKICY